MKTRPMRGEQSSDLRFNESCRAAPGTTPKTAFAPPGAEAVFCVRPGIKKAAGIGALRLAGLKIDCYEIYSAPVPAR
jgi:hypothetical protein